MVGEIDSDAFPSSQNQRHPFCHRFHRSAYQADFTLSGINLPPSIESGSACAKIPACFSDMADLVGVSKTSKSKLYLALDLVHKHHLHYQNGRLKKMFREF
jgi:hypothetical protein